MTQQLSETRTSSKKTTWVLLSSIREDTKEDDLQKFAPLVIDLIDEWQSSGKFIWSGQFSDNTTGMAIFEGTEEESRNLYDKYDKICNGVLNYHLYEWNALPFLSAL
jgi:hypothetical protein